MSSLTHLVWILLAAAVSFLTAFLFGDLLTLPLDIYYLFYFSIMFGFFYFHIRKSHLEVRTWMTRHLSWAVVAGVIVGFLMMKNVLSHPATDKFQGAVLWWEIFWRGIMYGTVDGLLLFAFPWVVTWRALHGFQRKLPGKIGIALLTWIFMLVITTSYHLGYADFRSRKIIQPNIGTTITSVPTLVTLNPVASTVSHVFLHVTAVIHSPETELFLPPHRKKQGHIFSDQTEENRTGLRVVVEEPASEL